MKLVVGLGNIGTQYARTRHNIGFMVVDKLLSDMDGAWKSESKLKADISTIQLEEEKIILAKPHTMMNLSGEAVQRIMQFYKIAPSDIWLVFDDLDVPFGRMRVRTGGMSGGHQGVNSTIQHIGAGFVRVRMGISLNDRAVEPSEVYVLKPFNASERDSLPQVLQSASDILKNALAQNASVETTFTLT
jgi:PTH1 family peptidyl-tRNA hydrolase